MSARPKTSLAHNCELTAYPVSKVNHSTRIVMRILSDQGNFILVLVFLCYRISFCSSYFNNVHKFQL